MGADKRKEQSLPYQDSRWSWIMSLVCCWCFFWALIINRCGGIVFVTMISEMGASRELASWPFSLLGTVSKLVGLVWGAMVKCFPVLTVAIAGSVLAASGILFCVVFYNVTAMIIGLGVITGLVWGALVKCFPVRTVAIAGSVLAASGILFCVVFYNVTAMIVGLGIITGEDTAGLNARREESDVFVRRASERLHYSAATVPSAESVVGGQTAKLCESEITYLVAMTPRYTVVFLHERQHRWSSARVEHGAARAVFAVPTGRRVICRRRLKP
ncbi:hypothetical protein HPB47_028404 [Ixodes persulcatus]|uniref:Uncharacterized protein n=1 Tax=Ixodes persulcatus TaxID=34615 RepID=A0AC60PTF0_IXOPE|nr:hypothetical protein HPB47_028404 [Ixodes persulcatus]